MTLDSSRPLDDYFLLSAVVIPFPWSQTEIELTVCLCVYVGVCAVTGGCVKTIATPWNGLQLTEHPRGRYEFIVCKCFILDRGPGSGPVWWFAD